MKFYAWIVVHYVDYHKHSKDCKNHNLMPLNELQSTKEKPPIKLKAKYTICVKHKLELNFYCETCEQLVCHDHDWNQ